MYSVYQAGQLGFGPILSPTTVQKLTPGEMRPSGVQWKNWVWIPIAVGVLAFLIPASKRS